MVSINAFGKLVVEPKNSRVGTIKGNFEKCF
jgi:hypothetical protein